ncbi:hypothetical protein SUGI_0837700 [Cryptomeria japonica]|nr:hypothetical protein SUGI_0837700 [Cryptomeria japonica]
MYNPSLVGMAKIICFYKYSNVLKGWTGLGGSRSGGKQILRREEVVGVMIGCGDPQVLAHGKDGEKFIA